MGIVGLDMAACEMMSVTLMIVLGHDVRGREYTSDELNIKCLMQLKYATDSLQILHILSGQAPLLAFVLIKVIFFAFFFFPPLGFFASLSSKLII